MSRRYTIAPSAHADLDEIWLYIAQRATIEVAERLMESIVGVFPLLAANPGMGRRRPNLGQGIHSFPVASHRIYYRLDGRKRVRILYVKHGARDEKKLFE
jgi:toxin ParE1/3/4